MRWAGHVERMGRRGVLVGSPEGKRPVEKSKSRWENNIKIVLRKIGCVGTD
jgi:hypothetical protein